MGTQTSSASAEWIEGHLGPPESGCLAALGPGGSHCTGLVVFWGLQSFWIACGSPSASTTDGRDGRSVRWPCPWWEVVGAGVCQHPLSHFVFFSDGPPRRTTHRDGLRCRQSYWVVIRETKLVVEQQQASSCRFADMLRLNWFGIRQRIPETTVSHWELRRQLQPRLSFNCQRARARRLPLRPFRFIIAMRPVLASPTGLLL